MAETISLDEVAVKEAAALLRDGFGWNFRDTEPDMREFRAAIMEYLRVAELRAGTPLTCPHCKSGQCVEIVSCAACVHVSVTREGEAFHTRPEPGGA
jgi:hypothetical protein